ncbi:CLUMA_CG008068, isoform A [Clunio marinus]|uniref:CLUMA_CG008068, isoform A n=1 Tax=Clunio marinus TaxID=568069 RepID=A0A1J1I2J7_9DIPT|nr:CLUMA_CG008068, isoform A [Clunio marinus]
MMTNCIICKKAANDLTFHDKSHPYFKLVLTKVLRKHGKIPRLRELLTCHKCSKKLTKNVKPQNEQNSLSFLLDTPELLLQNTPQSQPELLLLNSQSQNSQQSQPTVQQSASQIASSEELGQNMAPDDAASESVSINFNSNSLEANVLPPNFEDSINSSSSSEHLSIVIEDINQNRSHSNSAAPRRVQIAGTAGRNTRPVKKNLGG